MMPRNRSSLRHPGGACPERAKRVEGLLLPAASLSPSVAPLGGQSFLGITSRVPLLAV